MQIGMFYQIQVPKPWTPTSDFDHYWEMIDQIVLAEELGFASVWMADHQFRTDILDRYLVVFFERAGLISEVRLSTT